MKKYNIKLILYILIVLTIGIVVINYFLAFNIFDFDQSTGAFGDAWGFSNALLSALTMLFLILTVYLQENENKIQKQFSIIANLISNHMELTNSLSFGNEQNIDGRISFKYHFKQVAQKDKPEIIAYFKENMQAEIIHYFYSIYTTLKAINAMNPKRKSEYEAYNLGRSFRAQFNVYELYWLQVYFLVEKENEEFNLPQFNTLVGIFGLFKISTLDTKFCPFRKFLVNNNLISNNAYFPQPIP